MTCLVRVGTYPLTHTFYENFKFAYYDSWDIAHWQTDSAGLVIGSLGTLGIRNPKKRGAHFIDIMVCSVKDF